MATPPRALVEAVHTSNLQQCRFDHTPPLTLTFQSLCSPQTASHLVDHQLRQSSLPVNNRHTMKTQDDYNITFNHVGGHVVIHLSLAYKR